MVKWAVGAVTAAVLAVGLLAFEPWRAFTSSEIDEPVPTAAALPAPASDPASRATSAPSVPADAESARPDRSATEPTPDEVVATPEVLARGGFVDAEHGTSGTARILELADGQRVLRLEDLASSDGPDLYLWLSDRPSGGSWGSYDDGRYVELGALKATHGNQNYPIPDGADLRGMRSVVIWCDRFNVAFGTAPVSIG